MEIISFFKKKMKLITNEMQNSYQNSMKNFCKEKLENKYVKDKKFRKIRDHCHYTGEYKGSYNVPKNIPIAFHNVRRRI